MSYDANSNLIRLVDDNGGATTWSYDLLDRETVMTFHDGSTRTNVYNSADDIVGYTDENGSAFANAFDPLGRKTGVAIILATGVIGTTAQTFQFDGLSRTTFARDGVGGVNADVTFVRDSIDRTLEEAQTYNSDARYVTHDQWTSYPSSGFTFPNGRHITNLFDLLYRRMSVGDTGGASIAAWQFFGAGRTALFTLGNGITCSMMNNAQTASAIQSGGTYPPAWGDKTTDRLGYDGNGRMMAKRFLPSGGTTSLVGFTTLFDPSSNKLFERALHAESRSSLYPAYDSMNRLLQYLRGTLASGGASVTAPITLPGTNNNQLYNLDGLGNWKNTTITPEGGSAAVQTRTHNKLNELTQFATTPVLYDHGNNAGNSNPLIAQRGNGNVINDGTRIYAFDALNRLSKVYRTSDGLLIAAYVYDAFGRRVLKVTTNGGVTAPANTVANGTSRYIQDRNQIVEELTGTNATLRQFVWGVYIDELLQMKTYASAGSQPLSGGVYYPLQDLLYRTTALTNSSGSIVEAYDTDAYGNTLIFSGPGVDGIWFTNDDVASNQPACEYIFTGREYDPETQIYFFRARYYSSTLARFMNRDPAELSNRASWASDDGDFVAPEWPRRVGDGGGARRGFPIGSETYGDPNMYEYSGGDPVMVIDPLGLWCTSSDAALCTKKCSMLPPLTVVLDVGCEYSWGNLIPSLWANLCNNGVSLFSCTCHCLTYCLGGETKEILYTPKRGGPAFWLTITVCECVAPGVNESQTFRVPGRGCPPTSQTPVLV